MKISNLLIIAAFAVALSGLAIHDYRLKAMYDSKKYKDPLNKFEARDFKDFNCIHVNASGVANVKIVRGPFRVMVKNSQEDFLLVTQNGKELSVDASIHSDKKLNDRYYAEYRVYISCPDLKTITFDNQGLADEKPFLDPTAYEDQSFKNIIKGFELDSLNLTVDNGCYLVIDSNRINYLLARIGLTKGSAPIVEIGSENKIHGANINADYNSTLKLNSNI